MYIVTYNIHTENKNQYQSINQSINQSSERRKEGNGNFSGCHRMAFSSAVSWSNWNLGMLIFVEGGKPDCSTWTKTSQDSDENKQQT